MVLSRVLVLGPNSTPSLKTPVPTPDVSIDKLACTRKGFMSRANNNGLPRSTSKGFTLSTAITLPITRTLHGVHVLSKGVRDPVSHGLATEGETKLPLSATFLLLTISPPLPARPRSVRGNASSNPVPLSRAWSPVPILSVTPR